MQPLPLMLCLPAAAALPLVWVYNRDSDWAWLLSDGMVGAFVCVCDDMLGSFV
jgi:hypothetical protein